MKKKTFYTKLPLLIPLIFFIIFSCKPNAKDIKPKLYVPELSTSLYDGIYLPKSYINTLKSLKSHLKAMNASRTKESASALVITSQEVLFIYNFHEGVNRNFKAKGYNLEFDSPKDNLVIQEDGSIIDLNGVNFIKVSDKTNNIEDEISKIVRTEIFRNNIYKSDKHYVYCNNGQIIIDDDQYRIVLDIVFGSQLYDHICNKASSHYIDFKNNKIILYKAIIPEDLKMYIEAMEYATYQLEMELNKI